MKHLKVTNIFLTNIKMEALNGYMQNFEQQRSHNTTCKADIH